MVRGIVCHGCGYDLGGVLEGATEMPCPECGATVSIAIFSEAHTKREAGRRAISMTLIAMLAVSLAGIVALKLLSPREHPNAYIALPALWAAIFIAIGVAGSVMLRRNGFARRGKVLTLVTVLTGVLVWIGWQAFALVAVGLGSYTP
jgi:predicted RNA-binding Zn-ribbon protein involved in translation (DUF1610 family)